MSNTVKPADMPKLVGLDLEPSSWLEIDQQRINQFADATNDHQFIHVDAEKAAQTPFGGPIAHGYLTLSLLSFLTAENARVPEGLVMAINYGSDRVRFLQPVPVGSRVRALQKVLSVTEKSPGQFLVKTQVTIEIENMDKPALIADTLGLFITKQIS
jgi:acyl dehydratase